MKTKDKILDVAQDLFNKNGIRKVSVRSISEAMQISLGNFTYHFPSKKNLIVELYYKMIAEIEEIGMHIRLSKDSILFFLEYHKQLFKIQNSYKFFYLNNFELLKTFGELKQAYLQHRERQRKNFRQLFQYYVNEGIFKNNISEVAFERLISIGEMIDSFWIVDAEINFKGSEKKKLVHYLELCCSLIESYLTPTALQEYQGFFENLRKKT
jgi:AcrR family transcriptional regulator